MNYEMYDTKYFTSALVISTIVYDGVSKSSCTNAITF